MKLSFTLALFLATSVNMYYKTIKTDYFPSNM